jgi:hypothetical protein
MSRRNIRITESCGLSMRRLCPSGPSSSTFVRRLDRFFVEFVVAAGDAGSQRFPFSPALCLFHFQRRMFLISPIAAF